MVAFRATQHPEKDHERSRHPQVLFCAAGLCSCRHCVCRWLWYRRRPRAVPEPIAATSSEETHGADLRSDGDGRGVVALPDLTEINKACAVVRVCGTKSYPAAPPLEAQRQARLMALAHSVDMATKNYFAHNSLDGRTPLTGINSTGYNWSAAVENIAAGNATAAATVQQWIGSSGHCANLMSRTYVDMGIGYGYNATAGTSTTGRRTSPLL